MYLKIIRELSALPLASSKLTLPDNSILLSGDVHYGDWVFKGQITKNEVVVEFPQYTETKYHVTGQREVISCNCGWYFHKYCCVDHMENVVEPYQFTGINKVTNEVEITFREETRGAWKTRVDGVKHVLRDETRQIEESRLIRKTTLEKIS